MNEITSLNNPTVKLWTSYHLKKNRDRDHVFLVENDHLVLEAIKYGYCEAVWVKEGTTIDFLGTIYVSPEAILKKIAQVQSSVSMIGLCKIPNLPIKNHRRVFVCDDIQDPGNLGTIIRSALAFDFDGIYVSKHSVDFTNDKVVRATQGAIFQLPIQVVDIQACLLTLSRQGVVSVGLSVNQQTMKDCPVSPNMAFVLGNEGQGIHPEVLTLCDHQLTIPIANIESLNVAITAGIIAHQFSLLGDNI